VTPATDFRFDVFLSHSSKDKRIVRELATRLRADGLKVWLDEWMIQAGDSIPAKIEEGLEESRSLVLCMSANAFASEWAALESQTFRFRDPLNRRRRFLPLRLDDAPIKGSLAQFMFIDWRKESEENYSSLVDACRAAARPAVVDTEGLAPPLFTTDMVELPEASGHYAFSPDGRRALCSRLRSVLLFDLETGKCVHRFEGHSQTIWTVAFSPDGRRALSASDDRTVRVWDVEAGRCVAVLEGHTDGVNCAVWGAEGGHVISGASDDTVRLWEVETERCVEILKGHTNSVWGVGLSADGARAVSAGADKTLRFWDVKTGDCPRISEGHTGFIRSLSWGPDERLLITGGLDQTLRLWDFNTGLCLHVLKGHMDAVWGSAFSPDGRRALSCSSDQTVRLWDLESGECLLVLHGHASEVWSVAWSGDGRQAFSGDLAGCVRIWNLPEAPRRARTSKRTPRFRWGPKRTRPSLSNAPEQIHYTNAKVLLVGESGAGKTGLSHRLSSNDWRPSDSTIGAWATQWNLPIEPGDGVEREIWLWDFGGQADQRLIHQLYMDDTALAVLVFDGQKEDLFQTLGQWDRDLTRAARSGCSKLLVAGRVDAGGLRVSRSQIETFSRERGYFGFLETSAKQNIGCDELKEAILNGIRWEQIPWQTSPALFKRLKDEIVKLKDAGRVLLRYKELRETLTLRLAGEGARFSDEELEAVITLLGGPGIVWELTFGSWVLLQPERINAYAQAVIQTMRSDPHERGCISEERVLSGDLVYHSSMSRLGPDEERFILLAMHQLLVERGLCLREQTDKGPLLIFPSYYRRERPELVGHPAVLVSYRYSGFLDDIYATLVVRLHHTRPFSQDQLWRYAADFKTLTGKQLGIKLTRRTEGTAELEVYFEPAIPIEEKIIFSKYVHEHLIANAQGVQRLRHYVCPHCGTPVGNREIAMERLDEGRGDILCVKCEGRVPLWDQLEELFASVEIREKVHDLRTRSKDELDNESKERALVGEVISTVALAGQICREFTVSDHGIDMEVEFRSDAGEATGQKVYLQLKSGDSYLTRRRRDGAEIFRIPKDRHAKYWMNQSFPVLLVIRTSEGGVRWMEVRDWLKRSTDNGTKSVRQIVFQGQRLDVMSVRRWRDEASRPA
jgi:small GTP-binding protein